MSKIHVLIADDHAVVRDGLQAVIAREPDMHVVAQVEDGAAAARCAGAQHVDVVLLDMRMPGLGGVAAIEAVRKRNPTVRVLVLSMYEDAHYVRAALAAGASGYVCKRSGAQRMLEAIRAVHAGERHVDRQLEESVRELPKLAAARAELSEREREVLDLVLRGHTHREVAASLGISKSSVDTYRARILAKLGVEGRAELFSKVAGWALPDPDGSRGGRA